MRYLAKREYPHISPQSDPCIAVYMKILTCSTIITHVGSKLATRFTQLPIPCGNRESGGENLNFVSGDRVPVWVSGWCTAAHGTTAHHAALLCEDGGVVGGVRVERAVGQQTPAGVSERGGEVRHDRVGVVRVTRVEVRCRRHHGHHLRYLTLQLRDHRLLLGQSTCRAGNKHINNWLV